jgi:hypothetical protein
MQLAVFAHRAEHAAPPLSHARGGAGSAQFRADAKFHALRDVPSVATPFSSPQRSMQLLWPHLLSPHSPKITQRQLRSRDARITRK